MRLLRTVVLILSLPASLLLPHAASAEDNLTAPAIKRAKPAKSAAATAPAKERRPGELEGWDSGVKAPLKKSSRPPDAISEKALPDGGLPLPPGRVSNGPGEAPVGFDSKGNMGGMFKF